MFGIATWHRVARVRSYFIVDAWTLSIWLLTSIWNVCVSESLWPCGLQPARLLCPWDFPDKNTGVGCFPSPGDLPCPETELVSRVSCVGWWFFTTSTTWEASVWNHPTTKCGRLFVSHSLRLLGVWTWSLASRRAISREYRHTNTCESPVSFCWES